MHTYGCSMSTERYCVLVQVNEFVKRVRACKIHTLLVGHLRKQMPALMGKQKAQEKMLRDLGKEFSLVQREHHLPAGEALAGPCEVALGADSHGAGLLACACNNNMLAWHPCLA